MNVGKTALPYLNVQQINRAVEKWCDKHFPKYTDEDFKRMATSADIEFLQLCGECGFKSLDEQNAAWDRFKYLSECALDG